MVDEIPEWARRPGSSQSQEAAKTVSSLAGTGQEERVVAAEPLGAKGFFETISDAGFERVPVLGTAKQFGQYAHLLVMARRAERGTASQRDLQVLNNWLVDQQRGHTIMGGAADIALSIPKFAIELVAGAGVGKGAAIVGKKAVTGTLKTLISQLSRRGALSRTKAAVLHNARRKTGAAIIAGTAKRKISTGIGAGALAKGLTINAGRGVAKVATIVGGMEVASQAAGRLVGMEDSGGIISAGAASKALGRIQWREDEFGRFSVAMDQAIPGTLDLLPQGFIDGMIEVGTELSGGVLARGAKGVFGKAMAKAGIKEIPLITKIQALQMKAAERWLGKGGKNTMDALLKIAEKGKFNGIMGEFLEERMVGAGQILAQGVPGWEEDFDGMDALFPGWAQAASELAAFSLVPIGAAGVGAAQQFNIRRHESGMTRDELMNSRLQRRQAKGGDYRGAEALSDLGAEEGAAPLTRADIDVGEGIFLPDAGELIYEEIIEQRRRKTVLGGNALMEKMVNVGHGVRGWVGTNFPGKAFSEDPATFLGIQETMEGIFEDNGKIVFREGREENIEADKAEGRRSPVGAKGVDAVRRLIGMRKSRNIGEMMEKGGAVVYEELLRSKIARKAGESDAAFHSRQIIHSFGRKGRAGMDQATAEEFEAIGSFVTQGATLEAQRKLGALGRAMKATKSKSGKNWDRLLEDMKEAQEDVQSARAGRLLAGFQQFLRLELSADGTSQMPNATQWYRQTFAANHPVTHARLKNVEEQVRRFRMQSTTARVEAQSSDNKSPLKKWKDRINLIRTPEGRKELLDRGQEELVGSALALRPLVARMELEAESRGEKLKSSENPLVLDEAYGGMPAATNSSFAFLEVLSFNRKVRTDVAPLRAVSGFIKGRSQEFGKYLWARRTISIFEDKAAEYDDKGNLVTTGGAENSRKESKDTVVREGGMSYEDAQVVVAQAPADFVDAAEIYYKWWDAVLDYLSESSNTGKKYVERLRYRDPGDYVGIQRELEEIEERTGTKGTTMQDALGSTIAQKLEGGMELVGPVWENVLKNSLRMFDLAHALSLNEAIANGLMRDGMQDMGNIYAADEVEVVTTDVRGVLKLVRERFEEQAQEEGAIKSREAGEPAERIEELGNPIGALLGAAEQGGIEDMDALMDSAIKFTAPSQQVVKGDSRSVIPFRDEDGKLMYMEIKNPALMRWYNDKLMPHQAHMLWSTLALHKKLFTFSTTTGRILFQAFRNPARDVGTSIINTRTSGSALAYIRDALIAITSEYKRAFTGGDPINDGQANFMRMGLEYSSELANDSFANRRMIHNLSGQKALKVENAWNWLLDVLQAPERGVRTTELTKLSKEMLATRKLDTLEELSFDDKLDLILAAKRVSTNFTVAGRTARKLNRGIPFFNAQIQGPRDTIRAIMAEGDPKRRADKITRAIAYYTIPALTAWLFVKDEDWYIELTPQERASSWFIPTGTGEFLTFPLPFEIGTVFSAFPVLLADAAYRESPKETEWFISRFVAATMQAGEHLWDATPGVYPPSLRAALDLMSNNKSYWDTPIVSSSLMRLEEKAQYDEFTTHLARWIGSSAGELGINDGSGWSPKMIEHAVKGFAGPLGLDTMESLGAMWGLATKGEFSGTDAADVGGFRSLPIIGKQFKEELGYPASVTEMYEKYNKVQKRFDTKVEEESSDEKDVRLAMRDAMKAVSSISLMLRQATGDMREALKRERLDTARKALAIHAAGQIPADERKMMSERRKELEKEKKAIKAEIVRKRKESLGG